MITEEQIWNYLDDNLDDVSRAEVEKAIAADENAAMLFKEVSALNKHLKTETLMVPSSSFTDDVMAAVTAAPVLLAAPAIPFRMMLLFFLPTAAVILLFTVLIIGYHIPVSLHIPVIDFSRFKLLFILADALLLVYVIDALPQKQRRMVY